MSNLLFVPKKTSIDPIYIKPNGAYAASPIAEDSTLYEFQGDWFYVAKDRADLDVRIATGTWLTSTNSNQRVNITSKGVTKSILMNNLVTTRVTSFYQLFRHKNQFRQNISKWDTENVTNMGELINGAYAFNQDIGSWNIENVLNFNSAFLNASAFNRDLGLWYPKRATNLGWMFQSATSFNQNLSGWCVSSVTVSTHFANNTPSWTLPKPNFSNPPC